MRTLAKVRWNERAVREFCGRFLSEPKPQVFFAPPPRPLAAAAFAGAARRRGLVLDGRSRLLFSGTMLYMNGEALAAPREARALLRRLADARALTAPLDAPAAFWTVVHDWYRRGWIAVGGER